MTARTALILVSLVATLGGCGDSSNEEGRSTSKDNGVASKPATEILADTAAALKRVRSVRMQGTVAIGGKRTAVRIELEQPKKIRVALKEKDTTATLIVIGASVYIKANAAFWKQQGVGPVAENLADQWIEVPGSSADLRDLTKDISLATLSRCLVRDHGTLSVAGKERYNERPAVVLVDKGDRPGTAPGKLFVSTTGEPLPLRAITTGRQRPGGKRDPECEDPDSPPRRGDQITFSRYNEDLNIKAPPEAQDLTPGRSKS